MKHNTPQDLDIAAVLGEVYYREAIRCANRREWSSSCFCLEGMSTLLPFDLRAPLLQSKVLFRQGHRDACLRALAVARTLGHEPVENERMVDFVFACDRRYRNQLRRSIRWRRHRRDLLRAVATTFAAAWSLIGMGFELTAGILRGSRKELSPKEPVRVDSPPSDARRSEPHESDDVGDPDRTVGEKGEAEE